MAGGMLEFREIVRIYERERKTRSRTLSFRSSIKATACRECSVRIEDLVEVVALVRPDPRMNFRL